MRLINRNDLLAELGKKGLLTDEIEAVAKGLKVYATTHTMFPDIPLEDTCFPDEPRRVGEDHHDWLEIVDGHLEYRNMQNGEGTGLHGGYRFMPNFTGGYGEKYCCPVNAFIYVKGDEDALSPEEQELQFKRVLAKKMEERTGKHIENPDDLVIMS